MQFNYKYSGSSSIKSDNRNTGISFAPDTLRTPTFFVGQLHQHLPFREAMSALHDIVVSDLRRQPKDRTEYMAWVKSQEDLWIAEYGGEKTEVEGRIKEIKEELIDVRSNKHAAMKPFYDAQSKYFNYIRTRDKDMWFVLDPVITVHPDELFFECFSQDESSYGKVGCNYNVFKGIDDFECGTTNIDYSAALYNEFQKIRPYKNTEFKIDPSGFEVETAGEDTFKEVKIDLPDSWVRGFLQVSSAMTMSAATFDLHPMDMHNFLFVLKQNKANVGPRSIRFKLEPGKPVEAIFEPWNISVKCSRSIYKGAKAQEIRIWGRRRLLTLERLISVAKSFKITLLGTGLPSFFVADLGDLNFTLGLSGWTKNDWSRMGNFDLLAPRREVSSLAKKDVYDALKKVWYATPDTLAQQLNLQKSAVLGALQVLIQAGKVVYDLNAQSYRLRELTQEDLPLRSLRFANETEAKARELANNSAVHISKDYRNPDGKLLEGIVTANNKSFSTSLKIDGDERMTEATCTCRFFKQNKLRKGPCEHVLAMRMTAADGGQNKGRSKGSIWKPIKKV